MRATSITEFRKNIASMLDRVADDHEPLIVTRQGAEDSIVVSRADWESMEETLYLLSTPRNAEVLRKAIKEADEGKGVVRELIEE